MEDEFPNEKPVKNKSRPSLRDYFAAHAMQGFCARGGSYSDPEKQADRTRYWAIDAYVVADLMLWARKMKLVYKAEAETEQDQPSRDSVEKENG